MLPEKEFCCSWIEKNKARAIKISDEIWELAELGLNEFKSSALLADELENNGFKVERGVAGMPTAFIASYGSSKPVIGLLGEFDALPGLSQKRVPYKEPLVPGAPGHGCGHNIHGTTGMTAALAIKYTMEKYCIKGTIKFFGCPAEENFNGKVFMVREGSFRGVDAVLSHHPSDMNGAPLKSCLALNNVRFSFYGKSAHAGGSPHQGRSALDAVELMNVGANYLREHIIQDARLHYIVENGGTQPNIVPDYARSWYYVRAPERDQVEYIYNWVLDIAKGAAKMTRTEMKYESMGGLYNLVPNRTIAERITSNMREIGVPKYNDEDLQFAKKVSESIPPEMKYEELRESKRPGWEKLVDKLLDDEIPDPWGEGLVNHGSTDVGDVSWQTPTVEFNTATWVLGTPGHSWQNVAQSGVGIGHKSLVFAAKVMATTGIDLLTDADFLKKAVEEYRQRLADKKYKCPLPSGMKPPLDVWKKSV
ncbi:MAG: M20 family metallopeptidase [Candidatus Bathyarchaeia archaeon]